MIHASDCAKNNLPASPVGPCDCGLELALDAARHGLVAPLVTWARSHGFLVSDTCGEALIKAHELPPDGLITDAPASDLPNTHEPISLTAKPDGMNFDDSGKSIISEFKSLPLD